MAQSYTYSYNNLNQRWRVTREDGSYWSYVYNDRGELVSGKKYWSDNSILWGAQTEYNFDNIGNRNYARNGGNQLGSLRQSNYTANSLNQYSQRSVPGAVDVSGTANTAATVTVNNQATARRADYFYKELAVDNSVAPANAQINVVGARNNFGAGGEDAVTEKGGRVFVPQAVETFPHDDDGNLTSDGRWNYTWDGENRLVGMEAITSVPAEAKQRLEFSYDFIGLRIQKKVYSWNTATALYQLQATTKFVNHGWNMVVEIDGNNAVIQNYVRGHNLLFLNGGGDSYYFGYDGNDNIAMLIKASTGVTAASYEYDPFGVTVKAVGDYASQNSIRFSGKYVDQETGLIYYGYRYYAPQTGRWLNRDIIGEVGGINLYGILANDCIGSIDFLGLARESQIDNSDNPLTYSCNCGWIDWGHARPKGARGLWDNINKGGLRSIRGGGYLVKYSQEAGITIRGIPIRKGVVGDYFVRDSLVASEKESVALSIFKEVSEAFEESQSGLLQDGVMHSSFSEEDLVSNLIGFFMAVKGYSREVIETWCKVIKSRETNHRIWRNGGSATGKNRSWTPVFHEEAAKKSGCCQGKPQFPIQFAGIREAPKGGLYRDWIPRVDDFRRGRNPAPSSPDDIEDLPNPRVFTVP